MRHRDHVDNQEVIRGLFRFVLGVALENTNRLRSASVLPPADVRYKCKCNSSTPSDARRMSVDNTVIDKHQPSPNKLSVVRVEAVELGRAEGHRGTEKEAETGTSARLTGNCRNRSIHLRRSNASKGVSEASRTKAAGELPLVAKTGAVGGPPATHRLSQ